MKVKIDIPEYTLKYDKSFLKQVMGGAGNRVKKTTVELIRDSAGSGIMRNGHVASAPNEAPANFTGNLAKSLKVKVARDGTSVSVVDTAKYALSLESGSRGGGGKKGNRNRRDMPSTTRVMAPRPYLSTALDKNIESITKDIQDSVIKDINFFKKT
jgi:hypothetical protein